MRYLTNAEYENILLLALKRHGLSESQARSLIAARWPMFGTGLVVEAEGRGLLIALKDIQDWLNVVTNGFWADGEPIRAEDTLFSPDLAEKLFTWCVETGRAKPTIIGELINDNPRPLNRILKLANTPHN